MASVFVLSGANERRGRKRKRKSRGLGGAAMDGDGCRCVRNPRTGRSTKICFVGKSKKTRSGYKIVGVCR